MPYRQVVRLDVSWNRHSQVSWMPAQLVSIGLVLQVVASALATGAAAGGTPGPVDVVSPATAAGPEPT